MDDGLAGFDDEFGAGAGDAVGLFNVTDHLVVCGVGLRGNIAYDVATLAVVKFIAGIAVAEIVGLGCAVSTAGKGGGDEFGGDGREVGLEIIDA